MTQLVRRDVLEAARHRDVAERRGAVVEYHGGLDPGGERDSVDRAGVRRLMPPRGRGQDAAAVAHLAARVHEGDGDPTIELGGAVATGAARGTSGEIQLGAGAVPVAARRGDLRGTTATEPGLPTRLHVDPDRSAVVGLVPADAPDLEALGVRGLGAALTRSRSLGRTRHDARARG